MLTRDRLLRGRWHTWPRRSASCPVTAPRRKQSRAPCGGPSYLPQGQVWLRQETASPTGQPCPPPSLSPRPCRLPASCSLTPLRGRVLSRPGLASAHGTFGPYGIFVLREGAKGLWAQSSSENAPQYVQGQPQTASPCSSPDTESRHGSRQPAHLSASRSVHVCSRRRSSPGQWTACSVCGQRHARPPCQPHRPELQPGFLCLCPSRPPTFTGQHTAL